MYSVIWNGEMINTCIENPAFILKIYRLKTHWYLYLDLFTT